MPEKTGGALSNNSPALRLHPDLSSKSIIPTSKTNQKKIISKYHKTLEKTVKSEINERHEQKDEDVHIVVLGSAQSGKTSLVRRVEWGNMKLRSESGHEEIIARTIADNEKKVWKSDGRSYNVMDFSLDDKINSFIPKMFLTRDTLVVLVWDMAANNERTFYVELDDDELESKKRKRKATRALDQDIQDNVLFWINSIQNLSRETPILVVASNDDLLSKDKAQSRCMTLQRKIKEYSRKYMTDRKAKIFPSGTQPIIRVSSKTGYGYETLRREIIRITDATRRDLCGALSCEAHHYLVENLRKKVLELSSEEDVILSTKLEQVQGSRQAHHTQTQEPVAKYVEAFDFLSRQGCIHYYGNLSSGQGASCEQNELYRKFIVINHMLLVRATKSVLEYQDFQELQNEVEEVKIDLDEDPFEDYTEEENFSSACYRLPIISQQEVSLLLRNCESISQFLDCYTEPENDSDSEEHKLDDDRHHVSEDFLQFVRNLFVRFGAFYPIDIPGNNRMFFVPAFLDDSDPRNISWSYKNRDGSKTTLSQSWVCQESTCTPPDLMVKIQTAVLHKIIPMMYSQEENELKICEVLGGKSYLYLKMQDDIEILIHLSDQDNPLCIGSVSMLAGRKRLALSAKGPMCFQAKKIWKGGFNTFIQVIEQEVLESLCGNIKFEREVVCPDCLACQKSVSKASVWKWAHIHQASIRDQKEIRCSNGHPVDVAILSGIIPENISSGALCGEISSQSITAGMYEAASQDLQAGEIMSQDNYSTSGSYATASVVDDSTGTMQNVYNTNSTTIKNIIPGVVSIGLIDRVKSCIEPVGTGVVIDTQRGLIVTSSQYTVDRTDKLNFSQFVQESEDLDIVIGASSSECDAVVYRYIAKILTADSRHVDACVLWITKKFNEDIITNGSGKDGKSTNNNFAADDIRFMPQGFIEKDGLLAKLRPTENCDYEESVNIFGYDRMLTSIPNVSPVATVESLSLTSNADSSSNNNSRTSIGMHISQGYICKKFRCSIPLSASDGTYQPREEIVVIGCNSLSRILNGGPCVNRDGEVIGILSRTDKADTQRCYISPASEWNSLVRLAKGRVKFVRRLKSARS